MATGCAGRLLPAAGAGAAVCAQLRSRCALYWLLISLIDIYLKSNFHLMSGCLFVLYLGCLTPVDSGVGAEVGERNWRSPTRRRGRVIAARLFASPAPALPRLCSVAASEGERRATSEPVPAFVDGIRVRPKQLVVAASRETLSSE